MLASNINLEHVFYTYLYSDELKYLYYSINLITKHKINKNLIYRSNFGYKLDLNMDIKYIIYTKKSKYWLKARN